MSDLEQLRQATENTLHELTADESIKFRIVKAAAVANDTKTHLNHSIRPIPLICSVLAVLLICVFALNSLQPVPSNVPGNLNSFTAGSSDSDISSFFPDSFDHNSVSSISLDNTLLTDHNLCSLLINILQNQTVLAEPSKDLTQQGSISIVTSDGNVYSYDLQNPFLISQDGKWWSCPGFFTEMARLPETK